MKVQTATITEYAKLKNISRTTVYKKIKRGELKLNKQDEIILE